VGTEEGKVYAGKTDTFISSLFISLIGQLVFPKEALFEVAENWRKWLRDEAANNTTAYFSTSFLPAPPQPS